QVLLPFSYVLLRLNRRLQTESTAPEGPPSTAHVVTAVSGFPAPPCGPGRHRSPHRPGRYLRHRAGPAGTTPTADAAGTACHTAGATAPRHQLRPPGERVLRAAPAPRPHQHRSASTGGTESQ
ncbi:hypothetical protein HBB16_16190, partial [Pseudonocardia sp. MCCB 268]|nr:hypothetical protein [Pseudonocardia cytotoxica]